MAETSPDIATRLEGLKGLLSTGDITQEQFDYHKGQLVDTGGTVQGAAITISTDSALAFTKFVLRQQALKRMREQQDRDAKQLATPTLTDKDLATINVLSDAAVREAKAESGRGTSGFDAERLRAARDSALRKAAQYLSQKQSGEIASKSELGKVMRDRTDAIVGQTEARNVGLVEDLGKALANPEVAESLAKAGARDRPDDGNKPFQEDTLKEITKRVDKERMDRK